MLRIALPQPNRTSRPVRPTDGRGFPRGTHQPPHVTGTSDRAPSTTPLLPPPLKLHRNSLAASLHQRVTPPVDDYRRHAVCMHAATRRHPSAPRATAQHSTPPRKPPLALTPPAVIHTASPETYDTLTRHHGRHRQPPCPYLASLPSPLRPPSTPVCLCVSGITTTPRCRRLCTL